MRYVKGVVVVVTSLALPASALSAQKVWHPSLTSVAPSIVQDGATVTLTGSDLLPAGWRLRVRGPLRYGESVTPLVICEGSHACSNSSVTFPARKEWRGDSLYVEWVVANTALAVQNSIPANERVRYFPSPIVVTAPPVVTFAGTALAADAGTFTEPQLFVQNGQVVLKGKYLRRTSMPAVTFRGTALQVIGHSYEPQGQLTQSASSGGAGADRLVFAMPTEHGIGPLTVNNSLGTATLDVINVLPPVFTRVDQVTPTGFAPLDPPNTLRRGSRYVVRGQRLAILRYSGAAIVQRRTGQVVVNGSPLPHVGGSDTTVLFDVSAASPASLPLSVQTPGGSINAGTYSVVDAPARISVVGVTPTSATVISGTRFTLRVSLAIPRDAPPNRGSLILTSSGPAGALTLPTSVPVTGSDMQVELDVGFMQTTTPTTLTIAHESSAAGLGTQTRQVAVTIRPPRPIAIGGPDTLRSGTTAQLEVTFDSTTRTNSPLYVQLSSANANVVAVPPTATISGRSAKFSVTLPPNLEPPGTTTVTATIDGTSIQRTFHVRSPRMTRITASPTTARNAQRIDVTVEYEGTLPRGSDVRMESSDTALRVMNATQTDATQKWFRVSTSLIENRQVTITATLGSATASTIVQLMPVVIANVSASTNPARVGTTINVTATLSHSVPAGWQVQFASADASVAQVQAPVVGVSGTTATTPIQLLGTVASPRTVPITATLRSSGPTGPIISVQTVVLTVTP